MIRQASVEQIRHSEVRRRDGHIVVCMRFYPRGVRKIWIDEYLSHLAPDRMLFKDLRYAIGIVGHNPAFARAEFEKRFLLTPLALADLERFAKMKGDVYFVCQCKIGERCHREMLMLAARELFGARVERLSHTYPEFKKRLVYIKKETG